MYLVAVNLLNPREMGAVLAGEGRLVRIGRKPEILDEEEADALRVTWSDRLVSRNHCEALRQGNALEVRRLPALTGRSIPNALYTTLSPMQRELLGEPVHLEYGDSFIFGAKGTSAVFWVQSLAELEPALQRYQESIEREREERFEESPVRQQNYDEVEQLDEYSLRLQLKLLQRELPEQVLSGWTDESDLYTRASIFLEGALPGQKGVTAVFIAVERTEDGVGFEILNPDPNTPADFQPSRTLLRKINLKRPRPSDVHIYASKEHQRVFSADSLGEQIDWVAIIPVAQLDDSAKIYRDQASRPVYLYVETRQASETAAAAFIPFLRLISSLVASLLSARAEQKLQDQMAAYFSPGLRRVLRVQDAAMLEPAMVDCTVMFADRRGHSRMLEVAKSDEEILDRLDENQKVVGLITEEIFRSRGVVTDFAGDGALGLWGWPTLIDTEQVHAMEAIEAAESIVRRLSNRVVFEEEHQRHMAAVRIGISTGRIAVGKTGPPQQWHISVFGSVANLGSRLERIAKDFRIPVLISDDTYHRVKGLSDRRFRKLCLIRPAGFAEAYPIHELVLPTTQGGSGASDEDIACYEQALALFTARDWDQAIALLDTIVDHDPAAAWLKSQTQRFRRKPPPKSWTGEIQSLTK
jgi:class 3 adenylate cyclase